MGKDLDYWFDEFLEDQMFDSEGECELRNMWEHMNEGSRLSYAEFRGYEV